MMRIMTMNWMRVEVYDDDKVGDESDDDDDRDEGDKNDRGK